MVTVMMLMAVATGCSERREHLDALNRAIALMDNHPDSALSVLDSLGKHQADFGHHFSMQYRLHRLNAYNKLDTVFRTADEASQLVTYFEDHGTSNEQMLAYYLLGRAFFDLHEAPQALHYFQIASECADTTAADCNYKQLCRVYGQVSDIFYQQNLMNESLGNENKSIEYAWLGKDTLSAIRANINKVSIYYELSQIDLAIKLCEKTSFMAQEFGYPQIASSTLGLLIRYLIEKGELEKAKSYMKEYESGSGYSIPIITLKKDVRSIIILRVCISLLLIIMILQNTISVRNYVTARISTTRMQVQEGLLYCSKRHISLTPQQNMLYTVMP